MTLCIGSTSPTRSRDSFQHPLRTEPLLQPSAGPGVADPSSTERLRLTNAAKPRSPLPARIANVATRTALAYWVHPDAEPSFAQDYKSIAARLGLPPRVESEEPLAGPKPYSTGVCIWINPPQCCTARFSCRTTLIDDPRPADRQPATSAQASGRHRADDGARSDDIAGNSPGMKRRRKRSEKSVKRLLSEFSCTPASIKAAASERGGGNMVRGRSEYDRRRRPEVSDSILRNVGYLGRSSSGEKRDDWWGFPAAPARVRARKREDGDSDSDGDDSVLLESTIRLHNFLVPSYTRPGTSTSRALLEIHELAQAAFEVEDNLFPDNRQKA
ncbi:hypothetical protein PG991_014958 [Apiospora marii]|uniref:Uncharacterized protein n=1 Tax=Apiospora marii TaxID=335849 RepID=A0ABR1R3Q5_9PEZI